MKAFLDFLTNKFNVHRHFDFQDEKETVKGIDIDDTWYFEGKKYYFCGEIDLQFTCDFKNEIGGSHDFDVEHIKEMYNKYIRVIRLDLKINEVYQAIDDFEDIEEILTKKV